MPVIVMVVMMMVMLIIVLMIGLDLVAERVTHPPATFATRSPVRRARSSVVSPIDDTKMPPVATRFAISVAPPPTRPSTVSPRHGESKRVSAFGRDVVDSSSEATTTTPSNEERLASVSSTR